MGKILETPTFCGRVEALVLNHFVFKLLVRSALAVEGTQLLAQCVANHVHGLRQTLLTIKCNLCANVARVKAALDREGIPRNGLFCDNCLFLLDDSLSQISYKSLVFAAQTQTFFEAIIAR